MKTTCIEIKTCQTKHDWQRSVKQCVTMVEDHAPHSTRWQMICHVSQTFVRYASCNSPLHHTSSVAAALEACACACVCVNEWVDVSHHHWARLWLASSFKWASPLVRQPVASIRLVDIFPVWSQLFGFFSLWCTHCQNWWNLIAKCFVPLNDGCWPAANKNTASSVAQCGSSCGGPRDCGGSLCTVSACKRWCHLLRHCVWDWAVFTVHLCASTLWICLGGPVCPKSPRLTDSLDPRFPVCPFPVCPPSRWHHRCNIITSPLPQIALLSGSLNWYHSLWTIPVSLCHQSVHFTPTIHQQIKTVWTLTLAKQDTSAESPPKILQDIISLLVTGTWTCSKVSTIGLLIGSNPWRVFDKPTHTWHELCYCRAPMLVLQPPHHWNPSKASIVSTLKPDWFGI